MFFTKQIRRKKYLTKLVSIIINSSILIVRLFVISRRKQSSKIVIIALHRLGDATFTIPAIMNIIRFHKSNIYIVCYEEIRPIYELVLHDVNYVTLKHSDFYYNNRIAKSSTRCIVNNLDPSIVYDMTGDVSSASLILTCPAKSRVGINEKYFKSVYTKYTELRTIPHMVNNYLDAIKDVIPAVLIDPTLTRVRPENNTILIHPFASFYAKEWGLNKFIKLAFSLSPIANCSIISPPNTLPDDVIEDLKNQNINFIITESVSDLINVIKNSALLIGNDSGAVHIANLLGIPTFTIYGPTNPLYPRPLNGINKYIFKTLPCSPSTFRKWCDMEAGVFCPSNECMVGLSFNQVKNYVFALLEELKICDGISVK